MSRISLILIYCSLLLIALTGPAMYVLTIAHNLNIGEWAKFIMAFSCLISAASMLLLSVYRLMHLSKAEHTFEKKVSDIREVLFANDPASDPFIKAGIQIGNLEKWLEIYQKHCHKVKEFKRSTDKSINKTLFS